MSRPYDVMAAGHLCVDIIPRIPDTGAVKIEDLMRPGKLINVEPITISTGGPVSNTGIAMKTLGCNVCFCALVGDDELGRLTVDLMRARGNADGIHVAEGSASSYTVVLSPPNIDRIFLHHPGTNDEFGAENLDADRIAQCRHFHLGYPPIMRRLSDNDGRELQKVFQMARDAGATTSCDMTLPDPDSDGGKLNWRKILENVMPCIDMYLPSAEETLYMLYPERFLAMKKEYGDADLIDHITPEDYSRLADELLAMGAKMATLKSGARGFYLKTGSKDCFDDMGAARPGDYDNWSQRELWVPAFTAENFCNAAGSGDSSIAGLLSAFLRGTSIEESLRYAVCCGLQNVQSLDAASGVRSWDETTGMLKENMPVIDARVDADGWKWSDEHGLWSGPADPLSG